MKTTDPPAYPEYPLTITREQLVEAEACAEGLEAFDVCAPGGTLTISTVADHAALLSSPLAEFEGWAVENGLAPPIVVTSGYGGTSTSGRGGTSTSGDYGTSTSGRFGTSTSGDFGTSTSGFGGTSTSGRGGTSTSGRFGTSTSGSGGTLAIHWYDGSYYRLAVAYVGKDGIRPDVPYKLDGQGRFVRADGEAK